MADNNDAVSLAAALPAVPIWQRDSTKYRREVDAAFAAWHAADTRDELWGVDVPAHPLGELLVDCCEHGRAACVKVLLEAGAPADFHDGLGTGTIFPLNFSTPLHVIFNFIDAGDITRGQLDCAKLLLRHGASLDIESGLHYGGTPEEQARIHLESLSGEWTPAPNTLSLLEMLRGEPRQRALARNLRIFACVAKFHVLRMRAARRAYAPPGVDGTAPGDGFVTAWASYNSERRAMRGKRGREEPREMFTQTRWYAGAPQ